MPKNRHGPRLRSWPSVFFPAVHMKDRLFIATLVGLGFLATLGISFMHQNPWQPTIAPTTVPPSPAHLWANAPPQAVADRPAPPTARADAAAPSASAATEPAPAPESVPAPTYEDQAAARDRAAAHSARSR